MDEQTFRNRGLHVKLSSSRTGAKRTATTVISHVDRTASVEANGSRQATPASARSNDAVQTVGDRSQRTLGLMNIPDTVNDARIRALVEPYGQLVKIVLRPDHQGAIVEYRDVNDAGRASLDLEGKEIAPGRQIKVGRVEEMLRQAPERKTDKIQFGKEKGIKGTKTMMPVGPIKRPTQPGTGRRGGLGTKRGAFGGGSKQGPAGGAQDANGEKKTQPAGPAKSNSDFRAMLEQSRSKPEETKERGSF